MKAISRLELCFTWSCGFTEDIEKHNVKCNILNCGGEGGGAEGGG